MNYITINGQKSTLIRGLLIQSLPPISKPQMRAEIEEIDGRDGDIITQLGFAAYDKEVEIGLYGEYDVNQVIAFFNASGIVTFSNEPTFYYNFQILEQIDFEKLIRFKTATVTFHVQPFKYSTIETAITHLTTRHISIPNQSLTKNGLTVSAISTPIIRDLVGISGTATAATEIYMPINSLTIPPGGYELSVATIGTGASAVSVRLIKDSPSGANSFGGRYVTLQNNSAVTISANYVDSQSYNYLYFYITPGQSIAIDLIVTITDRSASTFTVMNTGNYISNPKITVYGSGEINLRVNGAELFIVELGDESYITIDSAAKEAYQDTPDNLKNRLVTGDYDNLVFQVGSNTISASGAVTEIDVENYSRWL